MKPSYDMTPWDHRYRHWEHRVAGRVWPMDRAGCCDWAAWALRGGMLSYGFEASEVEARARVDAALAKYIERRARSTT
jgi:hypothetical protein